jgi:hypothetical protein
MVVDDGLLRRDVTRQGRRHSRYTHFLLYLLSDHQASVAHDSMLQRTQDCGTGLGLQPTTQHPKLIHPKA